MLRRVLLLLSLAISCSACGSDDDGDAPHAVELTACADVTTSGRYVLRADLTADADAACLAIHDTTGVSLDCDGHTVTGVPAVALERVDRFRVERCRFERPAGPFDPHAPTFGVLRVIDGTNGIVTESRVDFPGVVVMHSSRLAVTRNEIDRYVQFESTYVRVADNVLVNPITTHFTDTVVFSSNGAHNQFVGNRIDGNWDGVRERSFADQRGADDGILLVDESDDELSDNVIRNVWDCGIETIGTVSATKFERNTIENAAVCGIGGWYWTSLRNDTFADNTVVASCQLFNFYRIYGLRPAESLQHGVRPADELVYIENNRFERNALERYPDGCERYAARLLFDYGDLTNFAILPGEREARPDQHVFANNLLRDNDFGSTSDVPVHFGHHEPGLVVDGGGNHCRQPDVADYPLRCE